ncbi:ATP-dependent peptidase [Hysterangium stoloniferum]|nr:ATP-dependent peptidase [Hysterangium stoloniferum]
MQAYIPSQQIHQSHSSPATYLRRSRDFSQFRLSSPPPILSRNLSLFKSQPLPPPRTLAQIQLLESSANASPSYVPAQIAYFQALVDSGLPKALQRVISRWERVLEFDQSNHLLRSDEAFQLYLTALVQSDGSASVDHAVRRREQVLTHPPIAEAPKVESTPEVRDPPSTSAQPPNASSLSDANPAPPLSNSQQVAQAVLATRVASSFSLGSGSNLVGNKLLGAANNFTGSLTGAPGGVKENPIFVSLSEPKGSVWYRIVRFVVLTSLGAFFILVLMAVLLENSGLLKTGAKVTAEFEPVEGKVVKFSDVHGVDEAKEELQEVVEFLKDPTNFATLGGKLPKGVLLTGPPGTGKTMLARAVAGEAGVPFLFASGSEFDEMFVGIGAKRIRELFASARKRQPSIIFIDELDAIGSKRSPKDQASRLTHSNSQTLNQLLVELDGFQQTEGVIVIAATNFPQSLDQALVRPGRFDRKISVPLPDVKGRVQILKHHMKNVITSEDVDPAILARGTPGFSGADLQNMVNQAAIQASREGYKFVLLKHFEWAKDRIVMGAERRSTYIEPKAKLLTAYHEGGHALVALYTEGAMPLHKVTCMPRGNALGYTAQLPEDDRYSVSFKEFVAEMDVCMGGRVAEELVYGPENVTSGCISDLAHATDVASRMVQNYGYSTKLGPVFFDDRQIISGEKRKEIEAEIRALVEAAQNRAKRLLSEKEEELHRLAAALVEHETLDSEEVKKVIRGEKIRENENLSEA